MVGLCDLMVANGRIYAAHVAAHGAIKPKLMELYGC
jgi:hypothetical protein